MEYWENVISGCAHWRQNDCILEQRILMISYQGTFLQQNCSRNINHIPITTGLKRFKLPSHSVLNQYAFTLQIHVEDANIHSQSFLTILKPLKSEYSY